MKISFEYYTTKKKFCINSTLQQKQQFAKIKDYVLRFGNISKDFAINNMEKTGLKGDAIFFFCRF